MAILASLPGLNLFSSLPSSPRNEPATSSSSAPPPQPPIPIPKYPPPLRKSRKPQNPPPNPAFKLPHRRTKYYKPVKDGVVSSDGDRAVQIGENGVSYLLPEAPFEFQYSYSETPKVKPLAIREPPFLPFAPPTMPRPWTGKAPLKKSKKKIPLFGSPESEGVKRLEMPAPFPMRNFQVDQRSREEILGAPLKRWEIRALIKPLVSDNRQVNLGRDGLTHNMLELIHSHWRRGPVCKIRCKGIPTVDMDNICYHLEEKTQGKVIHRVGGVVYLFCGRNYDYKTRPRYPVMLWKPAAPVYPKLIQEAPEGLTKAEADQMRKKGKSLLPICKLAKNGVYITLVQDVRHAFEGSPLVKVDCTGMNPSDYKKLGAKLKELVPCVLLSFDDEQILMWRGQNWQSMYPEVPSAKFPTIDGSASDDSDSDKTKYLSPKMMSLWNRAIESNKAILLDNTNLGPDELLSKVEEFEGVSQATEHSYEAVIVSGENNTDDDVSFSGDDSGFDEDDDLYNDDDEDDDRYEEDDFFDDEPLEDTESTVPQGSLAVDWLAEKLNEGDERR